MGTLDPVEGAIEWRIRFDQERQGKDRRQAREQHDQRNDRGLDLAPTNVGERLSHDRVHWTCTIPRVVSWRSLTTAPSTRRMTRDALARASRSSWVTSKIV